MFYLLLFCFLPKKNNIIYTVHKIVILTLYCDSRIRASRTSIISCLSQSALSSVQLVNWILRPSQRLKTACFLHSRPSCSKTSKVLHCFFCLNWTIRFSVTWYSSFPSVLWRCWLGGRKVIRPVKNWVVGFWRGYLSGAKCRLAYGPADAISTDCLLLQ